MSFEHRLSDLHQRTFTREIRDVKRAARGADRVKALIEAMKTWQEEATNVAEDTEKVALALASTTVPSQRAALIATWLRRHSPTAQLPGDLAALRRDLDLDVIWERTTTIQDVLGTRTEIALAALEEYTDASNATGVVDAARVISLTHPRVQTRTRANQLLAHLVNTWPDARWAPPVWTFLARRSVETRESPWARRAAAAGLAGAPESDVASVLGDLTDPDGFLVRAKLAEAAGPGAPWVGRMLAHLLDDSSELVRFTALRRGIEEGHGVVVSRASRHPQARTRAAFAEAIGRNPEHAPQIRTLLGDRQPIVLRFALRACVSAWRGGTRPQPELVAAATALQSHDDPTIRRMAERAEAWATLRGHPCEGIATELGRLEDGQRKDVVLPSGTDAQALAIALRPFAMEGFGFTLKPRRRGVRVWRGDHDRLQIWRILHEVRSPQPAKRQGHTHATGPSLLGPIRVPPAGLAEQSATGVPGQRIQLRDGDWHPEVPQVDDCRRALQFGEVKIVTGSGTVTVQPPSTFFGRLWARTRLAWSYNSTDLERSAAVEQGRHDDYLGRLRNLGFDIHTSKAIHPFLAYLLGTAQNTLLHLVILIGLLWLFLVGSNLYLRSRLKLHRRKIQLVIGGWGTRGKSGTERLKAGMLDGAGIPFVSKTTGCEAMILHGPRGGRVRELFLFRPYDKATIWEQADVVKFAARSGASAMLYECMALNPRYVEILQRGWMHDDFSTLTNAYPDHEDVMGPTGMDVAQVIGSFSPRSGHLFTTEDNMLPVLEQQAALRGTRCEAVDAVDKELLPDDLRARFPYEEHPYNIALAARVGRALGLHWVEAVGWMAERVIPDLGALMVYPPTEIDDREVIFVNGHSANDELSFTHSWRHTGFAAHSIQADPDLWLVGIINNRADRLPRSRVFARMAVRVAAAHAFLVIGTNLSGFRGMVREALDELLDGLRIDDPQVWADWRERLKPVPPLELIEGIAERKSLDFDTVDAYATAIQDVEPAPIKEARKAAAVGDAAAKSLHPELVEIIRETTARWLAVRHADEHPEHRKALIRDVLQKRVHTLDDAAATGDEVVAAATALAPWGSRVRMMGMQNIKGTGLDFCYQWVNWRALHSDLHTLPRDEFERTGTKRLTSVFHCDAVLERYDTGSFADAVKKRRNELLSRRGKRATSGPIAFVRKLIWWIWDPIDAIFRRRRARRILRDLAHARISHDRAVLELAALTKRQKG